MPPFPGNDAYRSRLDALRVQITRENARKQVNEALERARADKEKAEVRLRQLQAEVRQIQAEVRQIEAEVRQLDGDRARAEQERDALRARLRALGVDPDA